MNIKKVLFTLAAGLGLMAGGANMAMAQVGNAGTTAVGFGVNAGQNSAGIEGVAGSGADSGDSIINVVKNFLNWMLGLLALIAFAMLLFGGFQMVTAGGDENGYKKGFTILKNAAIGLAFIGVSWLIVTLIFYVLRTVAGTA